MYICIIGSYTHVCILYQGTITPLTLKCQLESKQFTSTQRYDIHILYAIVEKRALAVSTCKLTLTEGIRGCFFQVYWIISPDLRATSMKVSTIYICAS